MASRYLVFAAAGLWLALIVLSFAAFSATAPTGDSFTRGMNRIGVLLAWQAGAMVAALAALVLMLRRKPPRGLGVSLAGLAPMSVMVLELLAVVAVVVWAATRDPAERIERFYYPSGAPAQSLR
ncbi:MAG: hypothetical protein AB7O49_03165 [Sphingomonadales bacterium]